MYNRFHSTSAPQSIITGDTSNTATKQRENEKKSKHTSPTNPSGNPFPSHRSTTRSIFPSPSTKTWTKLAISFVLLIPFAVYRFRSSISSGFAALTTRWETRWMSRNTVGRPYHCAAKRSKPWASVRGSAKVAVRFQRERWRREGRPSKSWIEGS